MRSAVLGVFWGASLALSGPAASVAVQPEPRAAAEAAQPERLFVDSIVASVNDSAILQSRLLQTIGGDIQGEEARLQRPLTLDEIRILTIRELRRIIGNYQMAQSARSFGNFPPERFDAILEAELERDKEDLRRELGSFAAFSDELEKRGESWPTYVQGLKIEKLQMLAESFAIHQRLRKQQNLHVTPRMLRETYRQNRDLFVRPAAAQVAMVLFTGADARTRAAEAAEFWRTGDWEARQVADRFPGSVPTQLVDAEPLTDSLKQFALAGPLGHVSDPLPRGSGFVVIKIMQYAEARNGAFSDPEVQAAVRRMASNKVRLEFRLQALERARERTEVWLYERGRPVRMQTR